MRRVNQLDRADVGYLASLFVRPLFHKQTIESPQGGNGGSVIPITNPIICTARQTADGIVSECASSGGSNQVPAPGGLALLFAAGLIPVLRKRKATNK